MTRTMNRTDGFVQVEYTNGSCVTIAYHERERLETALKSWRRFFSMFEFEDEFGAHVRMRLTRIRVVQEVSPQAARNGFVNDESGDGWQQ